MSFLPWFPFYVNDFWSDEAVMCMNNRQVGIYLRLLSLQWREGSIPNDGTKLAALCAESPLDFQLQWAIVGECFEGSQRHPEGRLVNPRLESIRGDREAAHDAMSQGGKKGGKSKRTNRKQPRKPPSKDPEARKIQNKIPPISPPRGGGQVADAGEDKNEDPATAEDVVARWNSEALRGKRKAIGRLTVKEMNRYLDRLQAFPEFWKAISREIARLNDLTLRKQWLTFRWLIKSDDNFGRFADGEYSNGSKVTDENSARVRLARIERQQEEQAQRDVVESETLVGWPVGTRVKVISAKGEIQGNVVGMMGTVTGAKLRQVIVTLDEPVKIFRRHAGTVFAFDADQIQREDAENGAA